MVGALEVLHDALNLGHHDAPVLGHRGAVVLDHIVDVHELGVHLGEAVLRAVRRVAIYY